VLPVLVCRKEQTEAIAFGSRIEELRKNLTVEVHLLKEFVVNEEKDIGPLKRHGMDADVILLYKPRLGLGNCVIKIAEFGLPIILFDEEHQARWPLDAMEYIYPRENVWVAVDYPGINFRLKLLKAKKRIKGTKVLVLNSDYPHWENWLCRIPGGFETIKEKLGMEVEYVKSTDVIERWENVEEQKAKTVAEKWSMGAEKVIEPKEDDLIAVARLYLLMKNLLEERDAQAITMGYGDNPLPVPCFAYTNLRDEGMPAACEADIISLLLMIILHHLTGKPSFMGNLFVDPNDRTIMLSHCVAPRKMRGYDTPPVPYVLRDQHHGLPVGSLSAYVGLDVGREVTVVKTWKVTAE